MQDDFLNGERELLNRARSGSKSAFGQLVEPHLPRLLSLARRMLGSADDAEDALQTALASVWLARARLDPEKPAAPWLTTVTLNKCRDRLRRRKAAQLIGLGNADITKSLSADAPGPDVEVADREMLAKTARAIEHLPVKLREALVLVTIDGRSQGEAAALLDVTEKTIETRIYRARKRLRERLDFF